MTFRVESQSFVVLIFVEYVEYVLNYTLIG